MAPESLSYGQTNPVYLKEADIEKNIPTVTGDVETWSVSPDLPEGLALDPKTGVISGSPKKVQTEKTYTITAANAEGSTTAEVKIIITTKIYGKNLPKPPLPIPKEQLVGMILNNLLLSARITNYFDLKEILGDKRGKEVHRKLYSIGAMRTAKKYLSHHPSIMEILMGELMNFEFVGFNVWAEQAEEKGETVFYEHITNCPFLNYYRQEGITREKPCDITCKYDVEDNANKGAIGRWECMQRMADGHDECIFRIRPFKHFDDEQEIKRVFYDRVRLNYGYTARLNDA